MNQSKLDVVDWTKIPPPEDDGGAAHLVGLVVPRVRLSATDGGVVDVGDLVGLSVIFFYPMTGRPGVPLPEGWDEIPGARGCTPQSCAFRDEYSGLLQHGVGAVFGISTQNTDYQKEAWTRLHLPYPLLSDEKLQLTKALNLPTMQVVGHDAHQKNHASAKRQCNTKNILPSISTRQKRGGCDSIFSIVIMPHKILSIISIQNTPNPQKNQHRVRFLLRAWGMPVSNVAKGRFGVEGF